MTLNSVMAATLRYYAECISLKPTTSNWLEVDPYCLQRNCSPRNL